MAASRVPATLDALVSLAESTVTTATVYRGPFVTGNPGNQLFIGYDGDPDGDFRAVVTDTEWVGLGAERREERFEVMCAIVVTKGNADVKAAVDDVYVIHSDFEDGLRANPSLSQPPVFVAEAVGGELMLLADTAGLQARLQFRVRVRTRI